MSVSREYSDPRLAAVYDAMGPDRRDTDFYLGLAAELAASSVIDIGCGTGLLACALARRGHQVTGVDPAAAMLAVARSRPGGDQVRWIDGDASQLDREMADLAVMTGHVAQVIADDESWQTTLAAAHRAWYELTEVLGGGELVRSEVHYRFPSGAEEIISPNELRFRARATLTRQLRAAGFLVEQVLGDWDRRPAGPGTPEMIFVAVRR